jgi:hypothetical protein
VALGYILKNQLQGMFTGSIYEYTFRNFVLQRVIA